MGAEGGYAHNPKDLGGETYKGISRVNWPKWTGWKTLDSVKASLLSHATYGTSAYNAWVKHFNGLLASKSDLQANVQKFYEVNFWKRLGEITNQEVAEWVFDHVVNAGKRGGMWIQLAAKVKPDGDIGSGSIAAINAADPAELLSRVEDIAGAYRLDRAHDNPSQIQFLTSWLTRDGQPEAIIKMVRKAAADGKLDDLEVSSLKTAMEKAT